MISRAIEKAFKVKKDRGWDKLYVAVDVHDTLFEGKYNKNNEGKELYPGALEVMQWFSARPDIYLFLYSSSHADPLFEVDDWLFQQGILIDGINTNDCKSNELCDFSKKPYFNILLDDKSGFLGEEDWFVIKETLQKIGEWDAE